MADNVGYTEGSGKTVAADDIGGVLHQRVKISVGVDGAAADLAPGQATMANSLPVALASNQSALPVTDNSGSLTVDGAVTATGDVAHDGEDGGNPVKVGGKAVSAEPAAVANGDRANLITDLAGKLIGLPYANPENFVSGKTAAITDTTRTEVIAAQGAGVRLYITHIIVTNSHATVGTYVKIEDDTTEIYGGYAAAVGGGFSITLPVPLRLTANKALNVSCGTTGANVYAAASGYKGA